MRTLPALALRSAQQRVTLHAATAAISTPVPATVASLRGGAGAMMSAQTVVASLLGWTMSVAALSLYTPMIVELVQKRGETAEKISTTTWSLQLLGFVIFVIYHVRSGYPLSTFLDFAALGLQSVAILVLTSIYREQGFDALILLPVAGLVASLLAPYGQLQSLQLTSAVVTSFALVPQIVRNFRAKSRGGWSLVSALLSTVGNAIRVFTTVTLAGSNPLLLAQFLLGTALNGILAIMCVIWD